MAASQSPRHCFCQRRRSYKQMVQDIAEDLGAEDVQKIVFHHDLPAEYNGKPALTALRRMEMQGKFSDSDIEFLESLLQSIYRCDLINKHVMQYRRNYCGCESGAQGTYKYHIVKRASSGLLSKNCKVAWKHLGVKLPVFL